MRYWPIALAVVSIAGGWATLKADASQNKKEISRVETQTSTKVEKLEDKVEEQDKETADILVNQAKQGAVLENIYEAVKEIKAKK